MPTRRLNAAARARRVAPAPEHQLRLAPVMLAACLVGLVLTALAKFFF